MAAEMTQVWVCEEGKDAENAQELLVPRDCSVSSLIQESLKVFSSLSKAGDVEVWLAGARLAPRKRLHQLDFDAENDTFYMRTSSKADALLTPPTFQRPDISVALHSPRSHSGGPFSAPESSPRDVTPVYAPGPPSLPADSEERRSRRASLEAQNSPSEDTPKSRRSSITDQKMATLMLPVGQNATGFGTPSHSSLKPELQNNTNSLLQHDGNYEGWLQAEESHFLGNAWKNRYAVLRPNGTFQLFKDESKSSCKVEFPIQRDTKCVTRSSAESIIALHNPNTSKTLRLTAPNGDAKQCWLQALTPFVCFSLQ